MCILGILKTREMLSIPNLVLFFLIKQQWWNQFMKADLKHHLRLTSHGEEVLPRHLGLQEEVILDIEAVLQETIGDHQEVVMTIEEDMIIMIEDTSLATTTAIHPEVIIRVAVVGADIIQEVDTSITNLTISLITMAQEEDMMIETREVIRKKRNSRTI